ncbi:hypothetical protein TMatcc_000078 [Talaromyces marneffei ATCC 18224]
MTAIMPTPMSWERISWRSCCLSYSMTVVVTGRGSSPEPIGAGSTYLSVVKSVIDESAADLHIWNPSRGRYTLLLADLGLDIEVDAQNEHVGHDVESSDAEEHIGVFERNPLGDLHHPEDDDEVGTISPMMNEAKYPEPEKLKGGIKQD